MARQDLDSLVQQALKHRVVLIAGDEDQPRRQFLKALLAAVAPEGDDYDLAVTDAGETAGRDWLDSLATLPFLAERRTVVVRNLLRKPTAEAAFGPGGLKHDSVPPHGLLVLVADDAKGAPSIPSDRADVGEGEEEGPRRRGGSTDWEKAVKAAGGFVFAVKSDPKSARSTLKAECEAAGILIEPAALDLLVEMTGASLSRCLEELPKLVLYARPGQPITPRDVQDLVVASSEWEVFKFVDAVLEGNTPGALLQMRKLAGGSSKVESEAIQRLLPVLRYQFRLLWQARTCIEHGAKPSAIPEEVRRTFPAKPNLAELGDWQRGKAFRQAERLARAQLAECFEALAWADSALKGLSASLSGIETLEMLALRLVRIVGAGPAAGRGTSSGS
ncbi:MAG: hypothetical protein N2109_04530 [Fimbriimonadales bacterium]|nr:hypothetical protein [Fimbriimonadales bacterium]